MSNILFKITLRKVIAGIITVDDILDPEIKQAVIEALEN